MNVIDGFAKAYNIIRPVLDIGILTVILYQAYKLIVKTNAMQLIRAAIVVGMIFVLALVLRLETLSSILRLAAPGLLVGFAIMFQPELRKIFLKLGQSQWLSIGSKVKHSHVEYVLTAAEQLSHMKKGMLVVFQRHTKLDEIIGTGQRLDAVLSSNLLLTIFSFETAMHDGACVVQGGKIIAAGCFLPLSDNYDIRKTFGTRHRAALGTAEQTDAVVLIVSEESGAISLAFDSKLHYDLTVEQAMRILGTQLELEKVDSADEEAVTDDAKTIMV